MADDLTWSVLDVDSFDDLRVLAQACLEADGGLPLFTGEQMLGVRMLIGESIAARNGTGALVAAASVSVRDSGAITTGGAPRTPRRGVGGAAAAVGARPGRSRAADRRHGYSRSGPNGCTHGSVSPRCSPRT